MGATCCKGKQEDYMGCIFYKKIDIKLEKSGKEDLDKVFGHAETILTKAENARQILADAFKTLTKITGTCVLKNPDIEQCFRSFFIKLIAEFKKILPSSSDEAKDILGILSFSNSKPYLNVDQEKLDALKEKHKANPMNDEINDIMKQITDYLSQLEEFGNSLKEIVEDVNNAKNDCLTLVKNIQTKKEEYVGAIPISKKNIEKIVADGDIIRMFQEITNQFAEVIEKLSSISTNPNEIAELAKLGADMADKNIFEAKQLVWETTNETKLDVFDDWVNNFEYRVVGEVTSS